jgi:hypothetical protein
MSLRYFHLVFITAAALLAFGLAWWLYDGYEVTQSTKALIGAGASAVIGLGLIVYEIWFLRKTRKLIL